MRYRVQGQLKPGQKMLGPCGALKLKEARARALDFVRAGLDGEDLAVKQRKAAAEEQRKQAVESAKRVGTLVDAYLGGDGDLAARGIDAFVRAAATSGPKGKQASFASRAKASYGLVEKGDDTPRTLAAAFLRPVGANGSGGDLLMASVAALTRWRQRLAQAYAEDNAVREMDVADGNGTLAGLAAFAASLE